MPVCRASAREKGGLVVAAAKQTAPVQRNRHDQLDACQNFAPGAFDPARERRRGVHPVGVLEAQDERFARLVVAHHAARAAERGRVRHAFAAHGRRLRVLERQAAAVAERRPDEADRAPAGRAEGAGLAHRLAAGEAERRQHEIERDPRRAPQAAVSLCCRSGHRPRS